MLFQPIPYPRGTLRIRRMRVVALISGGKDSCFSAIHCIANGHDVVALANLYPESDEEEIDSMMFQTVGHSVVPLLAECFVNPCSEDQILASPLPLFRRRTRGLALQKTLYYTDTGPDCDMGNGIDEVCDLYLLLSTVKESMPDVQAVCSGAILSTYQRVRIEDVCRRLGLQSLAYLWQADQGMLLDSMIESGMNCIVIKTAAMGLGPEHLGKSLFEMRPHLLDTQKEHSLNVCGEGGEYESLTLDCSAFRKRIIIRDSRILMHSDDAYAPVSYLSFPVVETEMKNPQKYSEVCSILRSRKYYPAIDLAKQSFDLPLTAITSKPQCSLFCAPRKTEFVNPTKVHFCNNEVFAIPGLRACPSSCGDVATETRNVLCKLREILEASGLQFGNLVVVHVYVQKMADFTTVNKIYSEFFASLPAARACVEVGLVACGVQIDVVGACVASAKRTLHVPSISYWAPANIGPYSQCSAVGPLVFVAGQIGFVPETMALPGGFDQQAVLALRHLDRIASVAEKMDPEKDYLGCVCYHASLETGSCARNLSVSRTMWGKRGPLLGVVVPRLPRDAQIEWMAVGAAAGACGTDKEPRKSFSINSEHRTGTCKATFRLHVKRIESILSVVAVCSLEHESVNLLQLEVDDVGRCMLAFCSEIKKQVDDFAAINGRLFYVSSLCTAFELVVASCFDARLTTIVPCLAIEDYSDVAYFGLYASKD